MTTPYCINAWLDDRRAGCGRRDFLVARVGRKWVSLVALGSLSTVKLSRAKFDALLLSKATRRVEYKPTRLRRRIKTNAATYGVDSALVTGALRAIKTRPAGPGTS